MQALLEDLRPEIKKQLSRHAKWKELTIVSLNGAKQAVAVTNRAVYLFHKGLLGIKTTVIPLTEIKLAEARQNKLTITGSNVYSVTLPMNKQDLTAKAQQVINNLQQNRDPYTF